MVGITGMNIIIVMAPQITKNTQMTQTAPEPHEWTLSRPHQIM